MRIYIRSTNIQLWLVIKNGEEIPMKKVGETTVPKTEDEFDTEDIKKIENYAKAINILYCAVHPDDYRKISCYTTAKEMWDKLEVTYEGTDQVREAKIDFLTQEYEMLRMKEHENIDDMFDRFSKIVNDLHALKKTYTDRDLVRKVLRSLTSEWRSKADAIYESIGTSNVTIDGLRGNLKTYESTILNPSLNDQKKGIALKAVRESTMNDSSDDDEVKLVMKKFCKLLTKKEKVEDGPVCYGCGEAGQFKRQRAYISWGGDSGDESTDQDEDETANLCLIAHEDQTDDVQEGYDDLDAQLHQAGLWPFVSRARKEINPALIRAFYSNVQREGNVLYSLVKSTPIELSVEQLGRIAGLPYQGDDISHYGREDWVLNNEGLILNELGITELIRHASGRPTIHSANPESRLLLYIFVMINMTVAASTDHDHLLPYPFVVMDILERFKVTTTIGPLTKATKIWAISTQTFKKRSDNARPATAIAAPRRRVGKRGLDNAAENKNL
ncbi:unnamed protein product [Cuscuta campestris]|uniref:CCHC-type domain-containing protein n=1 Tax=Cuscuta campestris TaxID=132261 RepID=A0A484M9Q1_9ASTE|nr:unnamed protein product [Cuscuta campestris]